MRPLSLTVRATAPGERYDALNESAFRQEVARLLESLPAQLDERYLQLSGGTLSGALTVPSLTIRDGVLTISKEGNLTSIIANVADGDYGYLDMGGGTTFRGGAAQFSTFAGKVGFGALSPTEQVDVSGAIRISYGGSTIGTVRQSRYVSISTSSPAAHPALTVPLATSAKITVAMVDSSSGARQGLWELWVSSSSNYVANHREVKIAPNSVIGADVYWETATAGASSTAITYRTLVIDTAKDGLTNQLVVHIEHFTRIGDDISWLV